MADYANHYNSVFTTFYVNLGTNGFLENLRKKEGKSMRRVTRTVCAPPPHLHFLARTVVVCFVLVLLLLLLLLLLGLFVVVV